MKKKEKDLYKNENDKISTERESEKERYTFYMRLSCLNIYTHIYFRLYSERKEKNQNHKELFVHFDMQKTTV